MIIILMEIIIMWNDRLNIWFTPSWVCLCECVNVVSCVMLDWIGLTKTDHIVQIYGKNRAKFPFDCC